MIWQRGQKLSEQVQLFKIKTKAKGFKALAGALSSFIDEATITLTPEGINVGLLDASRKEGLYLTWPKEKFEQYEVSQVTPLTFYVNSLIAIFKRFSVDEDVLIDSTTRGTVLFTQPTTEKQFDCHLIADNRPTEKMMNVAYEGKFNMTMTQLEEMISDSEVFDAEEAWFESEGSKLVFKGKGDAGVTTGILIKEYNQEIKNTAFRFEYLKPFLQSLKPYVKEEIVVQIGPQKPLHLSLDLGEEIGTMEYFLAPKYE